MKIKAFRSRWANPIEPIENGPLIPACNYTDGSYLSKQCDPSTYEPENFPDFFLEDGRVIEANRPEISEPEPITILMFGQVRLGLLESGHPWIG